MATAASNVRRRICVKISLTRMILEAVAVWLPRSVINRCPATMFAISRTDRVIGRIKFLIDSIKTINGIRAPGVPEGTMCANI